MKKQLSQSERIALDEGTIDQVTGGLRIPLPPPGDFDPRIGIPLPPTQPPILPVLGD